MIVLMVVVAKAVGVVTVSVSSVKDSGDSVGGEGDDIRSLNGMFIADVVVMAEILLSIM